MVNLEERNSMQVGICSASANMIQVLVLNPLDVVKTRQQQPIMKNQCLYHMKTYNLKNKVLSNISTKNCICDPKNISEIVIREGILSLWRGVSLNVLQAGCSGAINLSVYEKSKFNLKKYCNNDWIVASCSTIIARTTALSFLFPLELQKVKYQAKLTQNKSIKSLPFFQTFFATFKRDILFNLIFWPSLESIRKSLNQIQQHTMLNHMIASSISGGLAGFISTPFDVIKTRKQLSPQLYKNLGNFQSLYKIYTLEGLSGIFNGILFIKAINPDVQSKLLVIVQLLHCMNI